MGVDFLHRRVLAKRVVDGRKPASGHESQLRQRVASGHPQGRSAAKEPQNGLTRRNPLTFDPTCCGFSHWLFAIYVRFYAAVNSGSSKSSGTDRRRTPKRHSIANGSMRCWPRDSTQTLSGKPGAVQFIPTIVPQPVTNLGPTALHPAYGHICDFHDLVAPPRAKTYRPPSLTPPLTP